jgi:hypothetical protein
MGNRAGLYPLRQKGTYAMTTKRKAPKAAPKANAAKADAERLEAQKRRIVRAQFAHLEMRLDRAALVLTNLMAVMQERKEERDAEGVCTCDLDEYIATVDLAAEYIEKTSEIAFYQADHHLRPEEREE